MEDMVHVKINGIAVEVPKGSTILEAARYAGVEIPTLCFLKDINEILPHLRGGSHRRPRPGDRLCVSGIRGDGGADQYRQGAGRPPHHP